MNYIQRFAGALLTLMLGDTSKINTLTKDITSFVDELWNDFTTKIDDMMDNRFGKENTTLHAEIERLISKRIDAKIKELAGGSLVTSEMVEGHVEQHVNKILDDRLGTDDEKIIGIIDHTCSVMRTDMQETELSSVLEKVKQLGEHALAIKATADDNKKTIDEMVKVNKLMKETLSDINDQAVERFNEFGERIDTVEAFAKEALVMADNAKKDSRGKEEIDAGKLSDEIISDVITRFCMFAEELTERPVNKDELLSERFKGNLTSIAQHNEFKLDEIRYLTIRDTAQTIAEAAGYDWELISATVDDNSSDGTAAEDYLTAVIKENRNCVAQIHKERKSDILIGIIEAICDAYHIDITTLVDADYPVDIRGIPFDLNMTIGALTAALMKVDDKFTDSKRETLKYGIQSVHESIALAFEVASQSSIESTLRNGIAKVKDDLSQELGSSGNIFEILRQIAGIEEFKIKPGDSALETSVEMLLTDGRILWFKNDGTVEEHSAPIELIDSDPIKIEPIINVLDVKFKRMKDDIEAIEEINALLRKYIDHKTNSKPDS